jgi:oligopeptide/dipeptide ABC transporter ATP-binding protein
VSLLQIRDLIIEYRTRERRVRSLDGATLTVAPGEIVGLVGESGSGKSTLAAAIGRLPVAGAHRLSGTLLVEGREVGALDEEALNELRRTAIGYVFQDPVASLDPTLKIGRQVALAIGADRKRAAEALTGLGFGDTDRVLKSYPHEVSGGMAQRIALGITLARRPRLIIADEPTAALDASVKSQILNLLVASCRQLGAALLLVTHDLHAVRKYAERVLVMYAGRVVEDGATTDVLDSPIHPYTAALLHSAVGREAAGERVDPIPGLPPQFDGRQELCAFSPRCLHATELCRSARPEARIVAARVAVCHYAGEAVQ